MSKYNYSEEEKQINNVLNYQQKELSKLQKDFCSNLDNLNLQISKSEELIKSLGYDRELLNLKPPKKEETIENSKKIIVIPSWDELSQKAKDDLGRDYDLEELFTQEELKSNEAVIAQLNLEYSTLHKLDKYDVMLSVCAGLVACVVDILLVGIPQITPQGLKAKPLSNFVREWFDKKFPKEEMEELAKSTISKVPYDAQDNRNTAIPIEGLSAYYHRLLSLGHDPILGFIFGVYDILSGKMTTIDKLGNITSQVMENYAPRKESDIFLAIAKQIIHLKSDITTSMGLPAPFASLFNLLQFGSFTQEEQTIAQIVQGMYYEGYDFIHFCSLSIPVMIIEVVIRLGYALKRLKEGYNLKDTIPFSLDRKKRPKLATMLFMGHSLATAVNTGKVCFTKNPLYINYPQWIVFAKYSFKQLKWVLFQKPQAQDAYVRGVLNEELNQIFNSIDREFGEITKDYIIEFE